MRAAVPENDPLTVLLHNGSRHNADGDILGIVDVALAVRAALRGEADRSSGGGEARLNL